MEPDIKLERSAMPKHFTMEANHFHEQYEIYYLLSGTRRYFIKDQTYRIEPGDLVFIDSCELHKTADAGKPGHERILILFGHNVFRRSPMHADSGALEAMFGAFRSETHVLRTEGRDRAFVESLLMAMLEEQERKQTGWQLYLQSLLVQLLLFASRRMHRSGARPIPERSAAHRRIYPIIAYINANYMHPLSLPAIAERFRLSAGHVSRTFKKVTGFTFVDYVNHVRVKEAQRMLRETDEQIIRISEKAGFDNVSHFGRVYKQITGLSPSTYRKQYRWVKMQ